MDELVGKTILGIHSNVAGDEVEYIGGHAWISVTNNGSTVVFGLWPDKHPKTVDNGDGTDIRVGIEGTRFPKASRFYTLNPLQMKKLERVLKRNVTWRYTNTCASWASEVVDEVIGINIDADDWGGFETPRELGTHIMEFEKNKGENSRQKPAKPETGSSIW